VQFFFGISHCTQHTIAVCSVLIALWDFLMQLKSKGHLASSGFVLVSFPIHTWDFCAMEIKGFCVWFHQVSCQIFPPTTVHNMRLLCRLKSKGSFHRALCCWGVFLFPHYTCNNNQDFLCNPNRMWFSSGVVLLFCTVSKNTMAKKKKSW